MALVAESEGTMYEFWKRLFQVYFTAERSDGPSSSFPPTQDDHCFLVHETLFYIISCKIVLHYLILHNRKINI